MRARGFALVELVATGSVAAAVVVAVILMGNAQRRLGRLGEDIGKLRSIGSMGSQYADDNADKFWTFSWKKGQSLSQYPDLNNAPSDLQAAANQAVDILRRRTGRLDIPGMSGWVPHMTYSHLTLADYGARVPDETFLSAADGQRLKWSRDPRGFDGSQYPPHPISPAPGSSSGKRWPYSSSFMLPTAFFDKSGVSNRIEQAGRHTAYNVSSQGILGARLLADTAYPAQKVLLHDSNARHFGTKQPYCTHDEARLPLAFVDGAVVVRPAADANPGWIPRFPALGHTVVQYLPDPWEPPTFSGGFSENVKGRFRWTRGFLDGRDFGGPEACTGQPGCP